MNNKEKLVCLLRVKDGMFYLQEWLQNIGPLVDSIVVVDNGSTDGTYEKLAAHEKVTAIERTEGFNEGRDKNLVYQLAKREGASWMLWLDVDELFEEEVTRKDLDKLMRSTKFNKYSFRRFHFKTLTHFVSSFKWIYYCASPDRILWRDQPNGYFLDVIIDSPNIRGITGITCPTHIRLKHTGYINKELIDKKASVYLDLAPEKKETIKKMYLENERLSRWNPKRRSLQNRLFNFQLDFLFLTKLGILAIEKLISLIKKSFRRS